MQQYITAGELAKLAGTTKRTIHFYDEIGILRPISTHKNKYRYYVQEQILDFQLIHLLSNLDVSLSEMKAHLKKRGTFLELFTEKKQTITNQLQTLAWNVKNLNTYTVNLKKNGTMIEPKIITLKPFGVYFIEKKGSYVKIGEYCKELVACFKKKGRKFTTLAIFENSTYQPKESPIKVGVIATKEMVLHEKYKDYVQFMQFSPGRTITYTHNGLGTTLSLFWKELEKYCRINNIEVCTQRPDFEIYWKINNNPRKQFFEIYLPV